MNEWPLPNSVLVIDNASIHKVAGIHEMVEERGVRLLYLPTYLPDLNPIELAFSVIKVQLRANWDHVHTEVDADDVSIYNTLWEVVYSVTRDHARGWYKHCGYQLP